MKNLFISLTLLFLTNIFTITPCYCEDFFIDSYFTDVKNKVKSTNVVKPEVPKEEVTKPKNKFLSKVQEKFSSGKEKPIKKFNYATNKDEIVPKGYYGSLPDISADFRYKEQKASSSKHIDSLMPTEVDLDDSNLKKAPYDDALFLDVIVKKEKASDYLNDLKRTRFALQNLKKCIEENGDIQHFNGCVNMVDLYSKNLKKKYENKSESLKASYSDILETAYKAKVVGNLLFDANYYARYVPTQDGQYSKSNINKQKQALLDSVNKTLFLIYQET